MFARRIPVGSDYFLELRKARNHRIIAVEDDLVVVPVHDFLNEIIIHEDAAFGVHFSIHPYLNPPLVAVEPVALSLVVEKPVTGLEKYLLVDAGFHSYSICIRRLIIIGETRRGPPLPEG